MFMIRDSKPEDFERVFMLMQQIWGDDAPGLNDMRHDFLEYIDSERDFCFCVEKDGQITGFCSANMRKSMQFPGDTLHIDILIVREGFRKKGIGTMLMRRAAELAREQECRAIQLDSGFQRTGAHEFYKKQGFRNLGLHFGRAL